MIGVMSLSLPLQAQTVLKIAIQPTFGAHQHIGYEIIDRLPKAAVQEGIQDLKIETVKTKSSIDGNAFLLNQQIDINVGSISSFAILDSRAPGQSRLLSAIGHYRHFLLCRPGINDLRQASGTKIAVSSRNTSEAHTLMWLSRSQSNDPELLLRNLIVMPRPQIYQMFKANNDDIKCVITGAPLQNQLMKEFGLTKIAESDVTKGYPGSYNAYWTRTDWAESNPKLVRVFQRVAQQVISDYQRDPKSILEKFIARDSMSVTVEQLVTSHQENSAAWHSDFRGAQSVIDILYQSGYLKGSAPSVDKLIARADSH